MLIAAAGKFVEASGCGGEGGARLVEVEAGTADLFFELDLGGWGVTGGGAAVVAAGV